MLFAMFALDKPGTADTRKAVHPDHLKHLDAAGDYGVIIVAGGPLVNDGASGSIGSMMVLEAAGRAAVETFNRDDPLQAVWGQVEIRRFDRKK